MSNDTDASRSLTRGRRLAALSSVFLASLVWAAWSAPLRASSELQQVEAEEIDAGVDFVSDIEPLLATYCIRCHGPKRQRADVRLDTLDPDIVNGPDAEGWSAALDMINSGEMPLEGQPQPTDEERRLLVGWITDSLDLAADRMKGESRTVLRRLNKSQYTHTLQDLLGLEIEFGAVLPDDGKSEMGFSNNGEVLQLSPLHIDYYQAIARQALEQAIVIGEQPEVSHYRVTMGKGKGTDLVSSTTGGYQSVPVGPNDFVVEIFDADGVAKVGADEESQELLDGLKRRITLGLRGSSQSRFRMAEEGMVLYSALPHKEQVPKAWQGPSPNLKLEMQRCFPQQGDFVLRVRASRGALFFNEREMLLEMEAAKPEIVAPGGSSGVLTQDNTIVLSAFESTDRENLKIEGAALVPEERTAPSLAKFKVQVPTKGYYQVDMVHPPIGMDGMPSVRLGLGSLTLDMRPELSEEQLKAPRVTTTLGAAYLRAQQHELTVGGPFFTGFSHLSLTPLAEDHPLMDRLRIENDAASQALQEQKTPWVRAFIGTRTDDGMDYKTFGERQAVSVPIGSWQDFAFYGRLENLPIPEPESGDTEILSGFLVLGLWNDQLVKDPSQSGPPLLVESLEFEAPYYPVWPPESHTDIFFESELQADRPAYTREVIARFAERAFRRTVAMSEVERYMEFWREISPEYEHYEEGVREVLVAVLCSPEFLYLAEPATDLIGDLGVEALPGEGATEHGPEKVNSFELANRLSYFLWDSSPDEELYQLARLGTLESELESQVDRMLEDERSWRFVRSFGREWLRVDRHEAMTVDPNLYPKLTRFVKEDMTEETYHFLMEVLRSDRSLFTLIDSDFAMLNQNLAEFYGVQAVAEVKGPHFRPVPIAPEERRGGLLSQGAFLSGHSDGSQAHPIKRAVWLKEKILGDAPPPPPPNVPDLNPEAPGFENLTLKEQLELHRSSASCVDCHRGIDPYGIVFERYDAAGIYQTERKGKAIDASSTLEDGTQVGGVDGIKAYILEEQGAAFAGSLAKHLFAYALGRDVSFSDEEELSVILENAKMNKYRMRSLIRAIVSSPSFLQR